MAKVPSVPRVPLYRETVRDGTGSKMVVPCASCILLLWGLSGMAWYLKNRTDGTDGTGELTAPKKNLKNVVAGAIK
jgi:hypothetical protein